MRFTTLIELVCVALTLGVMVALQYCDITALRGEAIGMGSADLSKIDVRGVPRGCPDRS